MDSFDDQPEIAPNDVHKYGVIIKVPFIYVDVNEEEDREDKVISNLRVIPWDELEKLYMLIEPVAVGKMETQIDLCTRLLAAATAECGEQEKMILQIFEQCAVYSKDADVDRDYVDIDNPVLSFDVIRYYEVDNKGLLVSATPKSTDDGYSLYSQLDSREERLRIRKLNKDTLYNRIQLHMLHFEKALTFQYGYLYDRLIQWLNLGVFYLCIYNRSWPVAGNCSNDLKSNMLGLTLDNIIRSRHIQAMQKYVNPQKLMKDLKANYKDQLWIQLMMMPSAKERAQSVLSKMKKRYDIFNSLDYNAYEQHLRDSIMPGGNGKDYYLFNTNYIIRLFKMMPDIHTVLQHVLETGISDVEEEEGMEVTVL